MQIKYNLDQKPPLGANLLFGLQWLFIALPSIVIIGKIVAVLHFDDPVDQVIYLQKMSFVMAAVLFGQVLWGHRLPLVSGPSTVLLIGVLAASGFTLEVIYTSVMIGGFILALTAIFGLFGHLQKLFTPRVIAVILFLVAFTLLKPVISLIQGPPDSSQALVHLLFAFGLILGMFFFQKNIKGIWKSTFIVWAMVVGTLAYYLIFSSSEKSVVPVQLPAFSFFFKHLILKPSFDTGVFLSFLFCFLALSINDLGSIESIEELIKPSDMPGRINRGITLTAIGNILAGFFGIVGPVNYSSSPGVILSTGCASRFPLIPAAVILAFISFSPAAMGLMDKTPPVVIGSVLLAILCFQISAGLSVVFKAEPEFRMETGLVIGLPVLLGTIIAFLPEGVINTFPLTLRPILGNGFVIGVFTAFILEHIIFRGKAG